MSDTEETSNLLGESENEDHLDSVIAINSGANSSTQNHRKSRNGHLTKNGSRLSSCLYYPGCLTSPRWIVCLVLTCLALLYLFSNLTLSLVNQRRPPWEQQKFNGDQQQQQQQQQQEHSLTDHYESEFNNRVVAPFRSLLSRLASKLSSEDNSGGHLKHRNLSAILPPRVQLNDSATMALIESERSNLAAVYYDRWKQNGFGANAIKFGKVRYCPRVKMISPHRVRMNNLMWQVVQTRPVKRGDAYVAPDTAYILNAYYDNRLWGRPAVKSIWVTDRQVPVMKAKWWCLLWFDNLADPVISKISVIDSIWPDYWDWGLNNGTFGPLMATCDVPKEYASQVPQAMSIQSTGDCYQMEETPGNVLKVIYNRRKAVSTEAKKPSIGVCVQAFRFGTYDVSVRLVEWLEMVRIMGAEKVFFYLYGATGNMIRVLNHYVKEDLVDWRNLTLPGEQPNVNSMYNYFYSQLGGKFWPAELIELNDCLYRNLYRYDIIAIFDIDEMPLPRNGLKNWHELIHKVESGFSEAALKKNAYYLNRHAYVYEMFENTEMPPDNRSIPDYLYTMRHVHRAEILGSGSNIKCFHRTDLVTRVHNHFPLRCLNTTGYHSCSGHVIDPADSILMHYRRNRSPPEDCKTPETPIKCSIEDTSAWVHFDELERKVTPQLMTIFGSQSVEDSRRRRRRRRRIRLNETDVITAATVASHNESFSTGN